MSKAAENVCESVDAWHAKQHNRQLKDQLIMQLMKWIKYNIMRHVYTWVSCHIVTQGLTQRRRASLNILHRLPCHCLTYRLLEPFKSDWFWESRPNFALFDPLWKLGERFAKCFHILWRHLGPNHWYTFEGAPLRRLAAIWRCVAKKVQM